MATDPIQIGGIFSKMKYYTFMIRGLVDKPTRSQDDETFASPDDK